MELDDDVSCGNTLFQQGDYKEAVTRFTKAITSSKKDTELYSRRAEAYEKLGDFSSAYEDIKQIIKLKPKSPQGQILCSRLLYNFHYVKASFNSAKLALSRLKRISAAERTELEKIKLTALQALQSQPNYFEKLPLELANQIFEYALEIEVVDGWVGPQYANQLRVFCLVCHGWLSIINETPSFWRTFYLSNLTPQRRIDAWLSRSNGLFSRLELGNNAGLRSTQNPLKKSSSDFWSFIKDLHLAFYVDKPSFSQTFPLKAIKELSLTTFAVQVSARIRSNNKFWTGIENMDTSHLKSLTFQSGSLALPWKFIKSCTSLTSLKLYGSLPMPYVLDCIMLNPGLENLDLIDIQGTESSSTRIQSTIELKHLRRLKINSEQLLAGDLLHWLQSPVLEDISLSYARDVDIKNLASREQPTSGFVEITISRCAAVPVESMLELVFKSPRLRYFEISHCKFTGEGDINTIVTALRTGRDGSAKGNSVFCPLLQYVDLTKCEELKTSTILRLVKAHLPLGPSHPYNIENRGTMAKPASNSPTPLPIEELILNECRSISTDALPWLRSSVPIFECIVKKPIDRRHKNVDSLMNRHLG